MPFGNTYVLLLAGIACFDRHFKCVAIRQIVHEEVLLFQFVFIEAVCINSNEPLIKNEISKGPSWASRLTR
jgi:hypothetical protein